MAKIPGVMFFTCMRLVFVVYLFSVFFILYCYYYYIFVMYVIVCLSPTSLFLLPSPSTEVGRAMFDNSRKPQIRHLDMATCT